MWVEPASGFDLSYAERDLAATVDSFLSLFVIPVGDSRVVVKWAVWSWP